VPRQRKHLRRYTVGTKGVNRITVYERATGATVYVEWRDDLGRHQKALTTITGHPVTDWGLAKQIADHMAAAQEQRRNRKAAEAIFGPSKDHTLQDLLDQLHADKAKGWSALHLKDQKRFQRFWLAKLGGDLQLVQVTPAMIEHVVREAGDAESWSPRTRQSYLRYIVDAFYYAQRKLKWVSEQHNLSAVSVPAPRSTGTSYAQDEIPRLLNAMREVDLRAAFVGEVAWVSGRRLDAIRTLHTSAVKILEGFGVLQFPGPTDKARRSGEVVLVDEALEVVKELLEMPAVRASGLFCVEGDLEDPKPRTTLTSGKALTHWLHRAEEIAGIPAVPGRAYHGIKRRFATAAVSHDEQAAEKQSGTNRQTLQRQYVQDDLEPKLELARELSRMRRGA
jgi:hypothetical protein